MTESNTTLIVTTNNLNNSNKARREQEEVAQKDLPMVKSEKKAISTARVKKESVGQKLKKAFFGENVENVGDYVIFDVMIPALKATLSDMVGNGIEVLLFGESRGKRRSRNDNYTGYASISRSDRDRRDRLDTRRDRDRSLSYNDITFDTKSDANQFLAEIFDYVKEYDRISVAVYMSILESYCDEKLSPTWRDDRIGWYKEDLSGTAPVRTKYGWEIDIPRPEKIS